MVNLSKEIMNMYYTVLHKYFKIRYLGKRLLFPPVLFIIFGADFKWLVAPGLPSYFQNLPSLREQLWGMDFLKIFWNSEMFYFSFL